MNKFLLPAVIILAFAIVIAFIISIPQVQTGLLFPKCTNYLYTPSSPGYIEDKGDVNPVIIHFHGNAGIAENAVIRHKKLKGHKYYVEYPGYSSAANTLMESEGDFWSNMLDIYKSIVEKHQGQPIVLHGRSIGTGVVYGLTKESSVKPDLVILETPVSSMAALTDFHFTGVGKIFKSLLAWNKMDYHKGIQKIPVLILASGNDLVTPLLDVQDDYKDSKNVTIHIHPQSGHNLPDEYVVEHIQKWIDNLHPK